VHVRGGGGGGGGNGERSWGLVSKSGEEMDEAEKGKSWEEGSGGGITKDEGSLRETSCFVWKRDGS